MNYIVVTNEWLSEHGIMPLSTMRKSKDSRKILMHEDYLIPYLQQEESEVDPENPNGYTPLERYPHNSKKLDDLLASEEWSYSEESPTESADFIQVAAVRNLMTATKAGIQTMNLTDGESREVKDMYPEWEPGIDVKEGEKYNSEGKLYKCKSSHKTQSDWKPGSGAFSLWEEMSRYVGTQEDPIPYNEEHDPLFAGMELEEGKYYTQDGVTYLCTRSTGQAVYNNLSELVGIYVQTVESESFEL